MYRLKNCNNTLILYILYNTTVFVYTDSKAVYALYYNTVFTIYLPYTCIYTDSKTGFLHTYTVYWVYYYCVGIYWLKL
jgi:hypothetical protein